MSVLSRGAAVKKLVGCVIKEWRETKLKISQEDFAERYDIGDRFVRMIEGGQYLPSAMKFIRMVLDMDWTSRGRLMVGFRRIKRGEPIDDEWILWLCPGLRA